MKNLKLPLPFKIRIDELFDLKETHKSITNGAIYHKEIQKYLRSYTPYGERYEQFRQAWIPNVNKYDNLIGVEVECEKAPNIDLIGWRTTEDHSLRDNGKEYISWILHEEAVGIALAGLYSILSLAKPLPKFSWRTSIHIHLNVRNFTVEEFLKLLLLYLAFEKVLFRFAGGERDKSNFCVPIRQSSLMEAIRSFCNGKTSVGGVFGQWEKYSALNLSRLSDYGTVEFRHLSGMWDLEKINLWIGMILSLSNAARNLTANDLMKEFLKLNTTSEFDLFSQKIFTKEQAKRLAAASGKDFEDGITACKECMAEVEFDFSPMKGSGMEKIIQKKVASLKKEPAQKKLEGGQEEINLGAFEQPLIQELVGQKLAAMKAQWINAINVAPNAPHLIIQDEMLHELGLHPIGPQPAPVPVEPPPAPEVHGPEWIEVDF